MPAQPKPAKSASKQETVDRPLDPSILTELGALDDSPLPSGAFESAGAWTHRYRIWTCYGHRDRGNRDQGALTLRRSRTPDADFFDLGVEQTVQMDPRKSFDAHRVAAGIRCRYDRLASPVSWSFSSRFTQGADALPAPELDHAEQARVVGNQIDVRIGDGRFEREASDRFTADWCLFEAVQRLPFGTGDVLAFDLLEGLTAWKPGQRLSYRGKWTVPWGGQSARLHCFGQLGMGVWPYEYWLDEEHRLLLAVTGCRVYIRQDAEGGAK